MPATAHYDPATLIDEIHISGIFKRAELSAFETEMASRIEAGDRPLLLIVLENFAGWEKGEDWNNLDFMFSHGDKIAKIAIVGAGDEGSRGEGLHRRRAAAHAGALFHGGGNRRRPRLVD